MGDAPKRESSESSSSLQSPRDSIAQDAPPIHAEETKKPVFVHPEARALFAKVPCLRYIPLFGEAAKGYGPRVTMSLGLSHLLCKGISDYLIRLVTLPLMTRYYGVDGQTYQRLDNVVNMGWSLKAITALVSDLVAFFKYTKRWYMFGSCVVGAAVTLGIGFLPPSQSSARPAAAMAFISCFTKANVDILLEGHYSRMIRRVPAAGPALVSWIWWFIMIGSLVAAVVVGPLSDANKPYICAFIASVFQLLTCVFFLLNWHGEKRNRVERLDDAQFIDEEMRRVAGNPQDGQQLSKKVHPEELSDDDVVLPLPADDMVGLDLEETTFSDVHAFVPLGFREPVPCCCGVFEVNKGVLQNSLRLTAYSVLMACGVITMAVLSMMGTTMQLLIGCVVVSVVLCGFNFYALPLIIAKANLYSYLQKAVLLKFPGALSGFYIAGPECVPDGPNFNFFFYNTVATIISNIAAVIGIGLFNYIFSKRSYRWTFVSTTIFGIIAALFDLIIVNRWNRPKVSDHAVYILGDAIVQQVVTMMNWMPMIVLLSKLCPRGNESMVYAIIAGFSNLGQSMASSIGSLVMELGWPVSTQPPCDFSNLPKLIILSGFLLPLVQIPLCFLLIPSARICDDLNIEGGLIKANKDKKTEETNATSPATVPEGERAIS